MSKIGDSEYNRTRNDLFCTFCNRQCHNMNSLNNHQLRCRNNPDRIAANNLAGYKKSIREGVRSSWNKGLTKETSDSVRKYTLKHSRKKIDLEIELDDDNKLYQKYMSKKQNDKFHEQRGFELTFEEYCKLVKEAGLKSSQLGFKGEGYVLARYNDEGPYRYGNCRFIKHSENIAEMFYSPRSEQLFNYCKDRMTEFNRTVWESDSRWIKFQIKHLINQIDSNVLAEARNRRLLLKSAKLVNSTNPSYSGVKNSQYGSFWITNGSFNSKWRESLGSMPPGFQKGRKLSLPFKSASSLID